MIPDAAHRTLEDGHYAAAAANLATDVATIRAVVEVESAGSGFLADGRVRILFERHHFYRRTDGRFGEDLVISHPKPGGYQREGQEWDRLGLACALDPLAALASTSWGLFQIMGFNYTLAGCSSLCDLISVHQRGASGHLECFVAFVRNAGLVGPLREHRWADFARGYNGPAYAKNRYDEKLAAAHRKYAAAPNVAPGVREIQEALAMRGFSLVIDGVLGPATIETIRQFQASAGLKPDGIPGPKTRAALGLRL